jgi:hypothetical protein
MSTPGGFSRLGLLILTRDGNIQQHTAELAAVRDNGGRLVTLSSKEPSMFGPSSRSS